MPNLTIRLEDVSGSPVADATVEFFDELGNFFGTSLTDSAGEAQMTVAGSDYGRVYHLRYWKLRLGVLSGVLYSFYKKGTVTVQLQDVVYKDVVQGPPAVSPNPRFCRLYTTPSAVLQPNASPYIQFFSLGEPAVVEGSVLPPSGKVFESFVDLPRGGCYLITTGFLDQPKKIKVPDADRWSLEDLFWPYVKTVTYSATALTMSVGDVVELSFSYSMSTGYLLDPDGRRYDFSEYAELYSSSSVAEVSLLSNSVFQIRAQAPGVAAVAARNKKRDRYPSEFIQQAAISVTVV